MGTPAKPSHGATKSLYGADPDGNEFEMIWMLSRDASSSRTPPRSIGFTSPPSFSVGPASAPPAASSPTMRRDDLDASHRAFLTAC